MEFSGTLVKNKIRTKLLILPLAVLFFSVAAEEELSEPREGTIIDRIVALVNDGVILETELDREVETFRVIILERGAQLPPEKTFRRQVLERMITNKLQMQLAERAGIQVSDDRLNQIVASIAERAGVSFPDFPAELEKQGINYAEYRDEVRNEYIMEVSDTTDKNLSRRTERRHATASYGKEASENRQYGRPSLAGR